MDIMIVLKQVVVHIVLKVHWSSVSRVHVSFWMLLPQSPDHTLLTLPFVPVFATPPADHCEDDWLRNTDCLTQTPVASCLDGPRFPFLSDDGNLRTSVHFESIGHETLGEDFQAYLGDLR